MFLAHTRRSSVVGTQRVWQRRSDGWKNIRRSVFACCMHLSPWTTAIDWQRVTNHPVCRGVPAGSATQQHWSPDINAVINDTARDIRSSLYAIISVDSLGNSVGSILKDLWRRTRIILTH